MNICFTSSDSPCKERFLNETKGFVKVFSPPPKDIDILVFEKGGDASGYYDSNVDLCIFSSDNAEQVLKLRNVNTVVSCGMCALDSVTFSSIGDDTALVCIRRRIVSCGKVFEPCEFKTNFSLRHGVYQNLVFSLLRFLTDDKYHTECKNSLLYNSKE